MNWNRIRLAQLFDILCICCLFDSPHVVGKYWSLIEYIISQNVDQCIRLRLEICDYLHVFGRLCAWLYWIKQAAEFEYVPTVSLAVSTQQCRQLNAERRKNNTPEQIHEICEECLITISIYQEYLTLKAWLLYWLHLRLALNRNNRQIIRSNPIMNTH